jgi:hypothetical protein
MQLLCFLLSFFIGTSLLPCEDCEANGEECNGKYNDDKNYKNDADFVRAMYIKFLNENMQ